MSSGSVLSCRSPSSPRSSHFPSTAPFSVVPLCPVVAVVGTYGCLQLLFGPSPGNPDHSPPTPLIVTVTATPPTSRRRSTSPSGHTFAGVVRPGLPFSPDPRPDLFGLGSLCPFPEYPTTLRPPTVPALIVSSSRRVSGGPVDGRRRRSSSVSLDPNDPVRHRVPTAEDSKTRSRRPVRPPLPPHLEY